MFLAAPGAPTAVGTHWIGQANQPVKADVSDPGERQRKD